MSMNPKNLLKTLGGNIANAARRTNKATGGENLSTYFGEKLAKIGAKGDAKKYVSQTVSGKDALKSAGKVGLNIASLTGAGTIAKGVSTGVKGILKKNTKTPKSIKSSTLQGILKKHKKFGDAKMLKTLRQTDLQARKN